MNETTTSFHIGDRVRIADTNPFWDGWTGAVSPSSAEQRAGDPATPNEHGRLLVTLDSGNTQQVLPQGLILLTYDYAIISGGWSVEQRRHIAEAMAAPGLEEAWGALHLWQFRLWTRGRPQAKLMSWQKFWGAPRLEELLERIRARTIYRIGDLPVDARQIERDALVERDWIRADELLSAACWVVERPSYVVIWSTAAQAVTPDTVLQQSLGVGAWPAEADAVPSAPRREPPDLVPWHMLNE